MDMVTLAMAKAYTDSKVGGGGSQGEVVIDIDYWGVNVLSLVANGGGQIDFNGTKEMWETINEKRNIVFKTNATGLNTIVRPITITEYRGLIHALSTQLTRFESAYGKMIVASINLVGAIKTNEFDEPEYTGKTQATVAVHMIDVP